MCDECREYVYIREADRRPGEAFLPNDQRRKAHKNRGPKKKKSKRRAPKYATCHYCPGVSSTWDHIVPRSKGGPSVLANVVPACLSCNQAKANRWPTCPCGKCVLAMFRFGPQARAGPFYQPLTTEN